MYYFHLIQHNITDSMDMNLSELRELVVDREAWHAAIHGVTKSRTWLSDWTELILWLQISADDSDALLSWNRTAKLLEFVSFLLLCGYFSLLIKSKDNGMKGDHHGKYWEIFCFSFFSNFHLRQVLIKAEQSENKDCAFHNYLRCAVLLQMF